MLPVLDLLSPDTDRRADATSDHVGLSWLVTVRWTTLLAGFGTVLAGLSGLDRTVPIGAASLVVGGLAMSNVWLMWRIRASTGPSTTRTAALLVCADVVLLTGLLLSAGGAFNPASTFYLVQIVMAALVLGRSWTWAVTILSVLGYATLFLTPSGELDAAQVMHPEIGVHMRGMWVAFAITALIIGVLVTRLAVAIERRDRAIAVMRDRAARATQAAGMATLATGAAHELSTPLATMAVAAHELERGLSDRLADTALQDDARLIRAEIDRCRDILSDLTNQSGEPMGEAPRDITVTALVDIVRSRLAPGDARRVHVQTSGDIAVRWPVEIVTRALLNLTRNGLQASTGQSPVDIDITMADDGPVRLTVLDHGCGMEPEHLARAGEPFFTTKAPGLGTGLGLFVTRSSLEQLGGSLTLTSRPGHGTTATIALPRDVVARAA